MSFEEDRMSLVGVLQFTRNFVEHMISRLVGTDAKDFYEAWHEEAKPQLNELIGTLEGRPREEDIRNRAYYLYEARGGRAGSDFDDWLRAEAELSENLRSEHGFLHTALRRVGLLGKSLKLKLKEIAAAASGGWLGKLFSLLNKFLGSLVSALPRAEAAKEIKEWLEDRFEDVSEPDQGLKTVYGQSDYIRFAKETS